MAELKWQAVFFDFDGVIADSVAVKTAAFQQMFERYGSDVVDQVLAYHLANGGMPRYQKLKYCYEQILNQKISDCDLEQLGDEFSSLVLEGVVSAPLIPGALESLIQLKQAGIHAFIVSGTPHREMETIVTRRGLSKYFQEVHGSPRSKTEIVRELLLRYQLAAENCLFIGDALADHKAANDTGTRFLAIAREDSAISFPPKTTTSPSVTLTFGH